MDAKGYGKDGPPTPRDALERYFTTDSELKDKDADQWQEADADEPGEAMFYLVQENRVVGIAHALKLGGSWIVDTHTLCESAYP